MTNRYPIIDQHTVVDLGDVGGGPWHACLAIGRDGAQTAWLVGPGEPGPDVWPYPPHECRGVMPVALLQRAWRCNRPTRSGQPCRRDPRKGSHRCWQHQNTTEDTK